MTGLRGVAALWVMAYHFFDHTGSHPLVGTAFIGRGYLGVDIFFLLSGFVLALSSAQAFQTAVTWRDYREFLLKRVARIYPAYFVATLILLGKYSYNYSGTRIDFHAPDLIANLVMVQAWGFGFSSLAGHTWSLSAELFAYLIFPPLAFMAVYARPALAACLLVLAMTFLGFVEMSGEGVNGPIDVVSSSSVLPLLRCLAGFCIGLLGYRLACWPRARAVLSSSGLLALLLAVCVAGLLYGLPDTVLFAAFALAVPMLFFQGATARLLFGNPAIYHFGMISYSVYLLHPLFVGGAVRLGPLATRILGNLGGNMLFLGAVLAIWGSAWLLYRCIEVPGRRLLRRMLLGHRVVQPV